MSDNSNYWYNKDRVAAEKEGTRLLKESIMSELLRLGELACQYGITYEDAIKQFHSGFYSLEGK